MAGGTPEHATMAAEVIGQREKQWRNEFRQLHD